MKGFMIQDYIKMSPQKIIEENEFFKLCFYRNIADLLDDYLVLKDSSYILDNLYYGYGEHYLEKFWEIETVGEVKNSDDMYHLKLLSAKKIKIIKNLTIQDIIDEFNRDIKNNASSSLFIDKNTHVTMKDGEQIAIVGQQSRILNGLNNVDISLIGDNGLICSTGLENKISVLGNSCQVVSYQKCRNDFDHISVIGNNCFIHTILGGEVMTNGKGNYIIAGENSIILCHGIQHDIYINGNVIFNGNVSFSKIHLRGKNHYIFINGHDNYIVGEVELSHIIINGEHNDINVDGDSNTIEVEKI